MDLIQYVGVAMVRERSLVQVVDLVV
ncbi:hypothetical protein ACFX13_033576 [Malus domestica]